MAFPRQQTGVHPDGADRRGLVSGPPGDLRSPEGKAVWGCAEGAFSTEKGGGSSGKCS